MNNENLWEGTLTSPSSFYTPTKYERYGWICPKCLKGVNPEVMQCPCSYSYTIMPDLYTSTQGQIND